MKKLVFLIVTFLFGVHNAYAQTDFSDFRNRAENFILSESENPAWKWYSPTITKETPFYSGDDNNPSYIEYKISCSDMKDCGWIIVNTDKSDTSIPIASFAGWTISEILNPKNEKNFKYYYFGILDYYAINEATGKLVNIWPNGKIIDNPSNIYYKNNDELNKIFNSLKKNAKENLESKKEDRVIQTNQAMFRNAVNTNSTPKYIWDFIRNGSCSSYTPCYTQGDKYYPEWIWFTWCTPTAMSIILWYYDRTTHKNILSFNAPLTTNGNITNIQTEIWNLMWTFYQYNERLNKGEWATYTSRNIDWWQFLNNKQKYSADYDTWALWGLVNKIKNEINNKRPVMISIERYVNINGENKREWHSIVAHGYKWNQIYTNFGWGNNTANTILSTDGNDFKSSAWNWKITRIDRLELK